MATIANLIVKFKANTKGLDKAFSKITSKAGRLTKQVAKFGGVVGAVIGGTAIAAFGALTASVFKTADALDSMLKEADNLKIPVKDLQQLRFQAEQSGVSAQQLGRSLQQMVRVVGEASNGSKRAAQALASMGVSLNEIKNLNAKQLFLRLADGLKNIKGQAQQAEAANVLFGRNWLSMLNLVRSDLAITEAQFKQLGIGISQTASQSIQDFNDTRNRLNKLFSGFSIQLTAQLAEPFNILLKELEKAIKEFGGLKNAANAAAKFILESFRVIVSAAEFATMSLQRLKNTITDIPDQVGRAATITASAIKEKLIKSFIDAEKQMGVFADAKKIARLESELRVVQRTMLLVAQDAEKAANRQNEALNKTARFFGKLQVARQKASESLEVSESFIPSIITHTFSDKSTSMLDMATKETEKQKNKAKERNTQADKWKEKLKLANNELRQANSLLEQARMKTAQLSGGADFGSSIKALSDIAAKTTGSGTDVFTRDAQQRILKTAQQRFQSTRFQENKPQRVEITLTADQQGIITPVVKSGEFNEEVVKIITKTIGNQARGNDR